MIDITKTIVSEAFVRYSQEPTPENKLNYLTINLHHLKEELIKRDSQFGKVFLRRNIIRVKNEIERTKLVISRCGACDYSTRSSVESAEV